MIICKTCGICCHNTEMMLSLDDIRIITENCHQFYSNPQDFYYFEEGFHFLTNIQNHCFFFDPSTNCCKIYDYRPQGCKFYPMIYDQNDNKCILDLDCPHRKIFYSNPSNFQRSCLNLRKWVQESLLKE